MYRPCTTSFRGGLLLQLCSKWLFKIKDYGNNWNNASFIVPFMWYPLLCYVPWNGTAGKLEFPLGSMKYLFIYSSLVWYEHFSVLTAVKTSGWRHFVQASTLFKKQTLADTLFKEKLNSLNFIHNCNIVFATSPLYIELCYPGWDRQRSKITELLPRDFSQTVLTADWAMTLAQQLQHKVRQ